MITVKNLTRYYGDFLAVDHIQFEIQKGEIIGLLGPNGAGKSTTLRMLTAYLTPSEGEIHIKDLDVSENSIEVKKLIGYLPESAPLYHDMLVYDYLLYVADILNLSPQDREQRIRMIAEQCGLLPVMHKSILELSKGYKQRVGLAHAMIGDPEILILDEPTSGLDPNQIIEIRELIKHIGNEKTVIISSHILSEIEATCNRVIIINKGKIVADSPVSELKTAATGAEQFSIKLTLQNAPEDEVQSVFGNLAEVENIETEFQDQTLVCQITGHSTADIRPNLYATVKSKDWVLIEFYREEQSLENVFRTLTSENA